MGIVLVADGLAESLIPILVGSFYDSAKSYATRLNVLIGLSLTGVLIVSFLPKQTKMER
jgi:hypothetical protein